MKKSFTTAILFCCFTAVIAQTKNPERQRAKFTSTVQLGIMEGQADKSYAQIQLLSGIQKSTWFYGLGLGLDYYGPKRSIPLFIDVKKDFRKGKRTPFLYADGGYNISLLRDKDKMSYWGSDYKQKGGLYYEAGIGYKFPVKNQLAFGLSAGYSVKQQSEQVTTFVFSDFPPYTRPATERRPDIYEYKFRRICLKFNCWF